MGNLFNPDAFLWRWCSRILDIMVLSIFWLVCSIPVVTIGAASTALYDAAVHGIRREEPGAYARFFRTFRRELKIAVPAAVLWGAALAALLLGGRQIGVSVQDPAPVLASTAVFALLMFFVLGIVCWMFPLLSRFTFSFGALNRTAWQFALGHLPSSFVLVVILCAGVWACWRFLFPMFFVPCTVSLLQSFLIEKAFQKHAPQEGAGDR